MTPHDINAMQTEAYAEGRSDQIEEFAALLPGTYYMDPPDGGNVEVLEQFRRMADDARKWRRAEETKNMAPAELFADLKRLRDAAFELCEETENAPEREAKNEHQAGFERGRRYEAKRIREALGVWFWDTFMTPELDAWPCKHCNGDGWTWQVRQVAERKTDVQEFKIDCAECNGTGWQGPDAAKAAATKKEQK